MGRLYTSEETKPLNRKLIGYIKCGEKGENNPSSLDYFIASGVFAPKFHSIVGEKPNSVTIVFNSDDDDDVCDHREEAYDTTGRLGYAIGDGEGGKRYFVYEKKGDLYIEVPEEDQRVKNMKPKLKEVLTLRFIIPALRGIYGRWEFNTRGTKTSIPKIIGMFDEVKQMTGGRIAGIPFELTVKKVRSHRPDVKRKFPIVEIFPNLCIEALERLSLYAGDLSKFLVISEKKIFELTGGIPETLVAPSPVIVIDQDSTVSTVNVSTEVEPENNNNSETVKQEDVQKTEEPVEEKKTETKAKNPAHKVKAKTIKESDTKEATDSNTGPTSENKVEPLTVDQSKAVASNTESQVESVDDMEAKAERDKILVDIINGVATKFALSEADKELAINFISESEGKSSKARLMELDKHKSYRVELRNAIGDALIKMYGKKLLQD